MKTLPIYQVDAFADRIFKGNPAAVVPLDSWLSDEILLNIAAENNLSETAYLIPSARSDADYDLRWFMPAGEVDLCGHATMASAYVVFNILNFANDTIRFSTRSGILKVSKGKDDYFLMDFPKWNIEPCAKREDITQAIGAAPQKLYQGKYGLAVFEHEDDVRKLSPNFKALYDIEDVDFLIVTAPSKNEHYDFVSRFLCPRHGVDEDPVTGSAHCILTPYWAARLNKKTLKAHQASKRGGDLLCTFKDDRVEISGKCALYLKGEIYV
ncbi:MAG: hypothetical protein CBB87_03105 [Micavibrio sp. TMED27]|nr:isomerase [Micavibrio sp.]OUT91824.1 MAG: hypothetical protein CBB87_03105 [Micavibrio sp. TMED27]|tara:strand:- start:338 stop:1141 length:804 start_codon:yes stop_codon:yes gene_type:complete